MFELKLIKKCNAINDGLNIDSSYLGLYNISQFFDKCNIPLLYFTFYNIYTSSITLPRLYNICILRHYATNCDANLNTPITVIFTFIVAIYIHVYS